MIETVIKEYLSMSMTVLHNEGDFFTAGNYSDTLTSLTLPCKSHN